MQLVCGDNTFLIKKLLPLRAMLDPLGLSWLSFHMSPNTWSPGPCYELCAKLNFSETQG